jgi:hypothetical protein
MIVLLRTILLVLVAIASHLGCQAAPLSLSLDSKKQDMEPRTSTIERRINMPEPAKITVIAGAVITILVAIFWNCCSKKKSHHLVLVSNGDLGIWKVEGSRFQRAGKP